MNGLKILIMLVSNWDNKDARETDRTGSNVGVLRDRKTGSEIYYVNDWGESLGSWGHHDLTRSRWNCGAFREQSREFAGVDDHGLPHFGFAGHHTDDFKAGLRLDDVRWLLRVLGRVSDGQIRDGLIAAGANAKEVECFTRELRGRISRLQQLTEGRR